MATLTETGQRRFVTHVPNSITLGNSTEREKEKTKKVSRISFTVSEIKTKRYCSRK